MSAFLVSRAHINQIVRLAHNETQDGASSYSDPCPFNAGRGDGATSRNAIGQMLLDQNISSLYARYGDTETINLYARYGDTETINRWEPGRSEIYVYAPTQRLLTIVEGLKALDCYDYQACESADYKQTDAAQFIDALRRHLIQRLPGYGEAETWDYKE